jgi:hypothetical protein
MVINIGASQNFLRTRKKDQNSTIKLPITSLSNHCAGIKTSGDLGRDLSSNTAQDNIIGKDHDHQSEARSVSTVEQTIAVWSSNSRPVRLVANGTSTVRRIANLSEQTYII